MNAFYAFHRRLYILLTSRSAGACRSIGSGLYLFQVSTYGVYDFRHMISPRMEIIMLILPQIQQILHRFGAMRDGDDQMREPPAASLLAAFFFIP